MQETINRKRVWKRYVSVAPEEKHKVLASDEVCVLNPVTKLEETHIVNTFKDEPIIDPKLRASDFSLEVQIRNGVQLKDCGKYFTPQTPEEYVNTIQNLIQSAESKIVKLESVSQASESQESIVEPSNS